MIDYTVITDQELAKMLALGDQTAFAEIYNRYKFILYNHAWNKTRDKQEAQDTLQEVFAMIWSKRATITIGNNLSGYLYTCVRNHILNVIVRRNTHNKYTSSILEFEQTGAVFTDHLVRENQFKALIDREIAALAPRMRQVFELSRKQHLSHKQIAEIMGTSEETVKKQMSRALKALRLKLGLPVFLLMLLFYR
jgi:RNA polymerase sigma-70 factor (family 1)